MTTYMGYLGPPFLSRITRNTEARMRTLQHITTPDTWYAIPEARKLFAKQSVASPFHSQWISHAASSKLPDSQSVTSLVEVPQFRGWMDTLWHP